MSAAGGHCNHHGTDAQRPYGTVADLCGMGDEDLAAFERRMAAVPAKKRTTRAPAAAGARERGRFFVATLEHVAPLARRNALVAVFRRRRLVIAIKVAALGAGLSSANATPLDANLARLIKNSKRARWTPAQQQRIAESAGVTPEELSACWRAYLGRRRKAKQRRARKRRAAAPAAAAAAAAAEA